MTKFSYYLRSLRARASAIIALPENSLWFAPRARVQVRHMAHLRGHRMPHNATDTEKRR